MRPLHLLAACAFPTLLLGQSGTFVGTDVGCPSQNPPSLAMSTVPSIGATNVVIASGLPGDTSAAFLVFGVTPINVSLAFLGAPNCNQLVGPIFASPLMALTTPTASYPIFVPNSAGFIGTVFNMQAAGLSPSSNNLGLATSDRGTLTIGWKTPLPVIPGLVLHLDASDPIGTGMLPADGSSLSTWVDLSGRGNNAAAGPASPIYRRNGLQNRPAVDFSAFSNDVLITAGSADFSPATATMFLVAQDPVTALVSMAVPHTYSHEMLLYARPGMDMNSFHHTSAGNYTELYHQNSVAAPFIQEAQFGINTIDVTNVIDGVPTTSALQFVGTPQPFPAAVTRAVHVGRRGLSSAENGAGLIAELLIFDRMLSAQERDLVGSYLEQKYGLDTAYP